MRKHEIEFLVAEKCAAVLQQAFAHSNTVRDSMIVDNTRIVTDVNATFRGIHARLDALEKRTNDPQSLAIIRDLAAAVGSMAPRVGDTL